MLYLRNEESQYWTGHDDHKPEWFVRHLADYSKKRFCSQFIAHWPDQYDWVADPHKWDYEPAFIFYESTKASDWNEAKKSSKIVKVVHSYGHYYVGHFSPDEYLPHTAARPRFEKGHVCLLLESGHHGYLPVGDMGTYPKLQRYEPPVNALTDEVIQEWKQRAENPFKIEIHLTKPWGILTDFQFK